MRASIRDTVGCALLAAASAGYAQPAAIERAPAFTGEALAALPTDDWITNGGNVLNQRYSPLSQINTETIGDLKLECEGRTITY